MPTGLRDKARSLLWRAVSQIGNAVSASEVLQRIKSHAADLLARRAVVPIDVVRRAALRISAIESLLVDMEGAQVRIDATFVDAAPLTVHMEVSRVFFAPRGGKELTVSLTPADATRHRYGAEIAIAYADAIAKVLWGPLLQVAEREGTTGGIAEREGAGSFRIDLRSLPWVRESIRSPLGTALVEAIALKGVTVRETELVLELALPISL